MSRLFVSVTFKHQLVCNPPVNDRFINLRTKLPVGKFISWSPGDQSDVPTGSKTKNKPDALKEHSHILIHWSVSVSDQETWQQTWRSWLDHNEVMCHHGNRGYSLLLLPGNRGTQMCSHLTAVLSALRQSPWSSSGPVTGPNRAE